MSWGHAELELDEDADERAVKRAYARRLRTTRPDDDPAGFQQLHEAYQAALSWAHYRAQWGQGGEAQEDQNTAPESGVEAPPRVPPSPNVVHDPASIGMPPPIPRRAPAAFNAGPALDVERFAHHVATMADQSDTLTFQRWLEGRPELWSLHDKPLIGAAVLQFLLEHEVPVRAGNFDLLSQCFSWEDIGTGVDPDAVKECRARLHRNWVVQPRNSAGLAAFLNRADTPVSKDQAQARLRRLTRPWSRVRALLSACVPGRTEAMRQTLAMLDVLDPAQKPANLQPRQVAFWLAMAQQKPINGLQMQVAVLRSLFCTLGWLALMGLIVTSALDDPSRQARFSLVKATDMALYGALAIFLLGSMLLPVVALVQWQVSAEHPRQRGWIVRLLFIPVLTVTALLVIHAADARIAGSILAWALLALACARFWVRAQLEIRFSLWMLFAAIPMVKLGAAALLISELAVAATLILWGIDAVNQVPLANARRQRAGQSA